jgi:DNA (cytosine-5)-methyltransferase 1
MSKPQLTHGSLFAGIGGFDLGFERAGFKTVWQVEIDEYCRRVLERHFPKARRFGDVKECSGHRPKPLCCIKPCHLEHVDVVTGGFPCQDISFAGSGRGLDGERSGLWAEYFRIVRELRPAVLVVENVAALLQRGIERVLGDLASIRYDAEWSVVSGCSLGSTHMRRRLFIVAYADRIDGRPRVRHTVAPTFWPLQEIDSFSSARTGWKARLANPSELYRDADGIPFGLERNRAIGNSVMPAQSQWIAERIKAQIETETP